ncbi:hypothetical protein O3P69_000466 [Scylla paramamosain]|uniref:Uncharacterized protein n=1 Tax=Scylla paramamosain TaxID=85552 RepID=A0AAW0UTA5_SCYPA
MCYVEEIEWRVHNEAPALVGRPALNILTGGRRQEGSETYTTGNLSSSTLTHSHHRTSLSQAARERVTTEAILQSNYKNFASGSLSLFVYRSPRHFSSVTILTPLLHRDPDLWLLGPPLFSPPSSSSCRQTNSGKDTAEPDKEEGRPGSPHLSVPSTLCYSTWNKHPRHSSNHPSSRPHAPHCTQESRYSMICCLPSHSSSSSS